MASNHWIVEGRFNQHIYSGLITNEIVGNFAIWKDCCNTCIAMYCYETLRRWCIKTDIFTYWSIYWATQVRQCHRTFTLPISALWVVIQLMVTLFLHCFRTANSCVILGAKLRKVILKLVIYFSDFPCDYTLNNTSDIYFGDNLICTSWTKYILFKEIL